MAHARIKPEATALWTRTSGVNILLRFSYSNSHCWVNYSFNTTDLAHHPHNNFLTQWLIQRGPTSSMSEKHSSEPKPRPLLPKGTHLPSTRIYKHTIITAHEGPQPLPSGLTYEALFSEDNDLPAHAYRRFPLWFGQGHILHLKRNPSELWERKTSQKVNYIALMCSQWLHLVLNI